MQNDIPQLRRLIESLVNGQCTDRQFQELRGRLESNAEDRAYYIEYLSLHAELRRQYLVADEPEHFDVARQLDSLLHVRPHQLGVTANPSYKFAIWLAIAATTVFLAMLPLLTTKLGAERPGKKVSKTLTAGNRAMNADPIDTSNGRKKSATQNSVAVLTHTVDVEWTNPLETLEAGSSLEPRNLSAKQRAGSGRVLFRSVADP